MGRKKLTLHDLFYNNKFVFFFSVILAFFIWVVISMTVGTEVTKTVENIPVAINLENSVPSQFNLKFFDTKTYYVDVKVKGKRYIVGSLGVDDIRVSAQTDYVNSVGKHTLNLVATSAAGENFNYEITDISQNYIEMYFDVYKEANFTLQTQIKSDKLIPAGYISESPVASTGSVLITGPATEINKIESVIARVEFDKPLTASTTVAAEIIPKNQYGGTMSYLTINGGKEVTVTIPVKKLKTLPVTVDFYDMPPEYLTNPFDIKISPATVQIAAEESYVDSLEKVSVGTIDFHNLGAARNRITLDAKMSDVKIYDGTESFTVTIDFKNMKSAEFDIAGGNMSISNAPAEYKVSLAQTKLENVTIVGPSAAVSELSADKIFADIDLTDAKLKEGKNTVKVKIRVQDNKNSWAYGSYSVDINAVKK